MSADASGVVVWRIGVGHTWRWGSRKKRGRFMEEADKSTWGSAESQVPVGHGGRGFWETDGNMGLTLGQKPELVRHRVDQGVPCVRGTGPGTEHSL